MFDSFIIYVCLSFLIQTYTELFSCQKKLFPVFLTNYCINFCRLCHYDSFSSVWSYYLLIKMNQTIIAWHI